MTAYYNEIDPYAAQWLRNLIDAGHIAPGVVDTRSIEDVVPNELTGFTQCHFFAGIGVWSYALRQAGWPDDRPVWTGSCPCQPFSSAGQGGGFADERHLWPAFFHLIEQCRPPVVFGEQVASRDANAWIDLVQDDLEGVGYGVGAVPFPSAGVGAPHIRDRLYWMADASNQRQYGGRPGKASHGRITTREQLERLRDAGGLEHSRQHYDASQSAAACAGHPQADRPTDQSGRPGIPSLRLADTAGVRARTDQQSRQLREPIWRGSPVSSRPGPTNGLWADADWLLCRDGKWRPVEPGTFPLAHGAPARVGRLRAYGNAINAEAARVFIEACM